MDLTKEVNRILQEFADEVDASVRKIEQAVADEAVKKLKKTSPKQRKNGGHKHYADDWMVDNVSRKLYSRFIVRNKQYQLTHLLENGHDVVRNGQKVGRYKGEPHIKPVEEWCKTEVEKRIREAL